MTRRNGHRARGVFLSSALCMCVSCSSVENLGGSPGPDATDSPPPGQTNDGMSGGSGASVRSERLIVTQTTNVDIATEYVWGFVTGIKQTLGSFKDGMSIHQITQSDYGTVPPPNGPPFRGNPDHIYWVDEDAGTFGISSQTTARNQGSFVNPGGMATFGSDGTIWFTLGGRAQELPLDLYRSSEPFGHDRLEVVLDDFETQTGSTATTVNVHDSNVMLFWRHRHSTRTDVKVRFQRYDIEEGFDVIQNVALLGTGSVDEQLGPVGIEQVWSRFDPRFNYTFVTWTFYDVRDGGNPIRFGSHPFLYSDDDGDIWRKADGQALVNLPLSYGEIDDVLVPYDHLAKGDRTDWQLYSDMGVSPGGVFWTAIRTGHFKLEDESPLRFYRFHDGAWQGQDVTRILHGVSKPHAVGVTKDYLVLLYAELDLDFVLKARLSSDDGATWSPPLVVRVLDPDDVISWISFAQPAGGYDQNSARFFFSFYQRAGGFPAKWWRNAVSWIKVDVGAAQEAGD